MFSLDQIVAMNSDAARKAKRDKKRPLVFRSLAEVQSIAEGGASFPYLSSYIPPGFELVEVDGKPLEYFVDTSGWGVGI